MTDNPLFEEEAVDELQDVDDLEDLEGLEGLKKNGIKFTPFKLESNELPLWKPGDVFKHRDFFYDVLRQYAIMTRRRVHVKRNDSDKLRAICKGQWCEWYVYLRKHEIHNGHDYVVMNMQRDHAHTCSQVLDSKWLTAKWLGERYMEKIKGNSHIPLAAIRQCVDEDFGLKIGRMKAYRAREHALDDIFGSAATQYRNLFYYKAELERTHPDSSIHIHYENTRDSGAVGPRFLRFYCCLGPLKKGWMLLSRPIIFFDACFLRGMYRGQLMTAMWIDPNNGWWPIAWAVTEVESYVQWKWFVEYLSGDLNLHANGPRYVFISDQQKGLAKLIAEEFPQSEHRFCVQHIYNNFKKIFVGEIFKDRLWEIASSTTVKHYVDKMDALQTEYPQAHQWLSGVAPKEKWVKELVDKWYARASSWRATWNGQSSYQVTGPSGQYVVNMRDFTCSCRLWQLTRIPYTHAIATINKNGDDVTRFVSRYYLKSTMIMLYENVLYPINGVDNWPKSTFDGALELAPPRTKRQRGRPKKRRREEPQIRLHADGGESLLRTFLMKCWRCSQEGHNKRTCINDPRTDARSQVGETSQHNGSRESGESTLPESSNNCREA
ncbi:uncharacterized protein LOC121776956 [Salvia splendens]|uniref:uncharacterized protein LOC121776956 n=1 Tax=Salvia splendens TaxID=180675 RepID=UPI001C271582|nr:uncharacterized protein LOC121776956 [Salvia splendens]